MLIIILVAAIAAVGDQLFKMWIVGHIDLGGQMDLIPKVIHLTYTQNTGAAFSMLQDKRTLLLIITGVCIIGIIVFLAFTKLNVFGKITAGLILGGAVGNAIDRVLLGYVVDMFEVEFMEYAVFNIADCCIVVGGILFCIYYIFFRKDTKVLKAPAADNAVAPEKVPSAAEEYKGIDRDFWNDEPADVGITISRTSDHPSKPSTPVKKPENQPEDVKTDWTETEILEEYSLDQILKDYYDKMD